MITPDLLLQPFAAGATPADIMIPPQTSPEGFVNFTDGYTAFYEINLGANDPLAKAVERPIQNYLFNALTKNAMAWQYQALPVWYAGKPGGYDRNALVLRVKDGIPTPYRSLVFANASDPLIVPASWEYVKTAAEIKLDVPMPHGGANGPDAAVWRAPVDLNTIVTATYEFQDDAVAAASPNMPVVPGKTAKAGLLESIQWNENALGTGNFIKIQRYTDTLGNIFVRSANVTTNAYTLWVLQLQISSVQSGTGTYAIATPDAGTNIYRATLVPSPGVITEGMEVKVKFSRDSIDGQPASFVLNGLTAYQLVGKSYATINASSIKAGSIATMQFITNVWVMKAMTGSPTQGLGAVANDEVPNLGQVKTLVNAMQPALGFVPVQQGGGVGQGGNKVYMGWAATGDVKVTVDSTDFGAIVFKSFLSNSATIPASIPAVGSTLVQRDASGVGHFIAVEVGYQNGIAGASQVDFHTSAALVDYDTRILSQSGTGVAGGGQMLYYANGGHYFYGGMVCNGQIQAVTLFANQIFAKAAAAVNSAPYYMYGEANQLRGVIYALSDNVMYFQCGSGGTTMTLSPAGNMAMNGGAYFGGAMTVIGGLSSGSTVTCTSGLFVSQAPAAGGNAHFWLKGEAGQNRGIMYAGADNVLRFQAGGVDVSSFTPSQINFAVPVVVTGNINSSASIVATASVYSGNGAAFFSTGGDSYGPTWGGYLSTWLNTNLIATWNLMSSIGNQPVGGVGTWALMYVGGNTQGPGWLVPGSSIWYSATAGGTTSGSTAAGTWKLMGYINAANAAYSTSVYMRVS